MNLRNTTERCGALSMSLHWLMALMITKANISKAVFSESLGG